MFSLNVKINQGRFDTGVAEQILDREEIHALLKQVGREGMA
jgi:hypothetical protein